ncbi:MAG: GntR family transcriptional regulator [Lentisphaeria bacterium]|nr:GntR family transcriptional regulator [Lentisphaeria bacterium]
MSKIRTITDNLREMIVAKKFADGKLPAERELAVIFNCCRKTVRSALANLSEEGWIDRCRKKGTTVRENKSVSQKGVAGLVMLTKGHFYEDIYHELQKGFSDNGYSVQTVSTNPIVENLYAFPIQKQEALQKAVYHMLESKPEIFVVNAYMSCRIPYFKTLCQQNTILVGNSVFSDGLGVPTVFFDYEQAGYIGGRYLLEQGCKRPVYFPHFISYEVRLNSELYNYHREKMLIDGFRRAMIEGGVDPETSVISSFAPSPKEHKKIIAAISCLNKSMPDGILSSDMNIMYFMEKLTENYGRIPENMVFAGVYNTPWSYRNEFQPFTSIDFNVSEIAKSVLKMAELPFEERKNIYISPELVIRERKIL